MAQLSNRGQVWNWWRCLHSMQLEIGMGEVVQVQVHAGGVLWSTKEVALPELRVPYGQMLPGIYKWACVAQDPFRIVGLSRFAGQGDRSRWRRGVL